MTGPRFRVAMVAPGPFPAPRGSQVLVRELAEALAADGHMVHVVAYGAGDRWTTTPGVEVHRTPRIFGGEASHGPKGRRVLLDAMLLSTLFRVVLRCQIDVIHAHNYEAPLLAYVVRALTGVPVVYHGHNVMSDELVRYFRSPIGRWAARWLGGALDRAVPRRADHVVALSHRMARFLRERGVAEKRMTVIPPGMAVSSLGSSPAGAGRDVDPYPGARVVLYAGNLDPYQDLSILIRAMILVRQAEPDALLVFVTHSTDPWIVAEAARVGLDQGLRVVVAHDFERVQALIERADVVACPRTSWSGFPIKLLNYLAAGRAIVASPGAATALEGVPLVVAGGLTPEAFATAIISTLRDPVRSAELGAAARRMAHESFAWSRVLPQVLGVYGNVLAASEGTGGSLQECKKMLQKTALWELMEGWRGVARGGAGASAN